MRKEEFIKVLKQFNTICMDELYGFMDKYHGIVDELDKKYLNSEKNSEERYMIDSLIKWLQGEGYEKIQKSLYGIDYEHSDRINDFINLYSFLLENAKTDVFKLINQLFFIPNEFYNLFGKEESLLRIPDKVNCLEEDKEINTYVLINGIVKEVLGKASYLFERIVVYEI